MRRILIPAVALLVGTSARGAYLTDKAIEDAAKRAVSEITPARLGEVKSVAVLPLWNDDADGYAADMVKSQLTSTGVQVLVRSEKEWKSLLDEIEWNVKREDVMDASTIQRFGRIKGCDAVLYGTVREVSRSLWGFRGTARLSLHIADVETGQIVWSKAVDGESYSHWSDVVVRFWDYPLVWVIVLVVVVVGGAVLVLRRAATPR